MERERERSLNAAQDTLPHNSNLAMWRRKEGLSDECKLCGKRQTLAHVLNQCPVALQLRRYNTRHDAVLKVLERGIKPLLSDEDQLIADLPDHQPYIFPPHIFHTDLRPDIVIWNNSSRTVCLTELTICYETRFDEAHAFKESKYLDLTHNIQEAAMFTPELITLEVGSRGPFDPCGFDRLKAYITAPNKEWDTMLTGLTQTVLLKSHKIWTTHNWRDLELLTVD